MENTISIQPITISTSNITNNNNRAGALHMLEEVEASLTQQVVEEEAPTSPAMEATLSTEVVEVEVSGRINSRDRITTTHRDQDRLQRSTLAHSCSRTP